MAEEQQRTTTQSGQNELRGNTNPADVVTQSLDQGGNGGQPRDLQSRAGFHTNLINKIQQNANHNNDLIEQQKALTETLAGGPLDESRKQKLTPEQRNAVEQTNYNQIAQQLGQVKFSMSERGRQFNQSLDFLQTGLEQQRQEMAQRRQEARDNLMQGLDIMGSKIVEGRSEEEIRRLERNAGLNPGFLKNARSALQEQERRQRELEDLEIEQTERQLSQEDRRLDLQEQQMYQEALSGLTGEDGTGLGGADPASAMAVRADEHISEMIARQQGVSDYRIQSFRRAKERGKITDDDIFDYLEKRADWSDELQSPDEIMENIDETTIEDYYNQYVAPEFIEGLGENYDEDIARQVFVENAKSKFGVNRRQQEEEEGEGEDSVISDLGGNQGDLGGSQDLSQNEFYQGFQGFQGFEGPLDMDNINTENLTEEQRKQLEELQGSRGQVESQSMDTSEEDLESSINSFLGINRAEAQTIDPEESRRKAGVSPYFQNPLTTNPVDTIQAWRKELIGQTGNRNIQRSNEIKSREKDVRRELERTNRIIDQRVGPNSNIGRVEQNQLFHKKFDLEEELREIEIEGVDEERAESLRQKGLRQLEESENLRDSGEISSDLLAPVRNVSNRLRKNISALEEGRRNMNADGYRRRARAVREDYNQMKTELRRTEQVLRRSSSYNNSFTLGPHEERKLERKVRRIESELENVDEDKIREQEKRYLDMARKAQEGEAVGLEGTGYEPLKPVVEKIGNILIKDDD